MAVADEQRVFDLTARPGFAVYRVECGFHYRHDTVQVVSV
jgi:hypothetical protein